MSNQDSNKISSSAAQAKKSTPSSTEKTNFSSGSQLKIMYECRCVKHTKQLFCVQAVDREESNPLIPVPRYPKYPECMRLWEPTFERSAQPLGASAVIFHDRAVYREVFNLHTSYGGEVEGYNKEEYRDVYERVKPSGICILYSTRIRQIRFTRGLVSTLDMNVSLLRSVWPIRSFNGTLAAGLLDVIVEEEAWVAKTDRRSVISRAALATLIGRSVFKEALQN
ncbi:hypothetical protein BKA65DRAFT_578406 [Rhexocercosporidium sp. MPI-PUGE-AT-0058]|nr:hypothetical protein BKA65DRAFT_578406 [Rhexocercosporidium sp. MPI-PUGE-AT-0058]